MTNKIKKLNYNIQLSEIKKTDDPTIIPCTFIILDFNVSYNNSVISKDVALESAPSLLNKAIVAKYYEAEEPNTNTDAFGGHEVKLKTDKYNELGIVTDTVPIGTFVTEGYILEIGEGDNKKEVLACDAVLWRSRFSDAIDLLIEWYSRGVKINTSCELLYQNFTVKDGIEEIHTPIFFEGHAILNSENRGNHEVILPAYEDSQLLSFNEINKFQKLVAQAVKCNEIENINKQEKTKKEDDIVGDTVFKKVYELSHGDIRSRLYQELDAHLGEGFWTWIVDVYEDNFIVEVGSDEQYNYYKYTYVKVEENQVSIDFESKIEVIEERKWVELEEVQKLQTQLNELSSENEGLVAEKTELETKLNSKDEIIKELEDYKNSVEKAKFEAEMKQKLEEQTSFYSAKFSALNASAKFDSDEVQDLISKSIGEDDEAVTSKLKLNEILIDLVEVKETKENEPIREFASVQENLIPDNKDFDSRYSV